MARFWVALEGVFGLIFRIMEILRHLLGLAVLLGICLLFSKDRKQVSWRLVGMGILLQAIIALLIFKAPFVGELMRGLTGFFVSLLGFAQDGAAFLFGPLVSDEAYGFIFAFKILPTIVFFSALTSILYYYGILQAVVWGFAYVMKRTMRLSGTESLSSAANIFVGQTEAPLIIKPYIKQMSDSQIVVMMTSGMATIAGAVFVTYIAILGGSDPEKLILFGMHLVTASLLSAPAAIVCAKILVPEDGEIEEDLKLAKEAIGSNVVDATVQGSHQGVLIAINVGAALLVFTALIGLFNYLSVNVLGSWNGLNEWIAEATSGAYTGLTLEFMFGVLFAPFAWLIGVDSSELLAAGQLLGQKVVFNEFVAYTSLVQMMNAGTIVGERSVIVLTYALCGFANFASLGIQIGGLAILCPEKRPVFARYGFIALIGGTIACLMTANIAGIFS
jgi:concentrative nucleoside transporter, CNT family